MIHTNHMTQEPKTRKELLTKISSDLDNQYFADLKKEPTKNLVFFTYFFPLFQEKWAELMVPTILMAIIMKVDGVGRRVVVVIVVWVKEKNDSIRWYWCCGCEKIWEESEKMTSRHCWRNLILHLSVSLSKISFFLSLTVGWSFCLAAFFSFSPNQ